MSILFKSDPNLIPLSRAASNRYHLLQEARGTFALILDGDDEYIDIFDDAIEFLNCPKNTDFVGCAHQYVEFHVDSQELVNLKAPYPDGASVTFARHATNDKYFSLNTVVFRRRAALEALLGMEIYCNDTTLTKLLLQKGPIRFSQQEVMLYRKGMTSIYSGAPLAARPMSQMIVQEENLKLFPQIKDHTCTRLRQLVRAMRKIQCDTLDPAYGLHPRRQHLPLSSAAYDLVLCTNPAKRLWLRLKLWSALVRLISRS